MIEISIINVQIKSKKAMGSYVHVFLSLLSKTCICLKFVIFYQYTVDSIQNADHKVVIILIFDIRREMPLYAQIYIRLKDMILSRQFSPKDRMIDTQLATKFKVSRSPIRETLRKLEHEGLVENNRGVITVYNPSLLDVIELYKVRTGLEYVAAYWATKYIDQDLLSELQHSLLEVESALKKKDYEEVMRLNTFFHDTILSGSKNIRLQVMMEKIRSLIVLYRQILFENFSMDYNFLPDHQAVLNAMIEGDSENAAKHMENHIMNDMEYFKKIFNEKVGQS